MQDKQTAPLKTSDTFFENTSGQGKGSSLPPQLNHWNWGAFFFVWVWGLSNKVYTSLLTLIPGINVIMIFILGAKGNEWAWQNKKWDSVEQFIKAQRRWATAGIIMFVLWFILTLVFALKYLSNVLTFMIEA